LRSAQRDLRLAGGLRERHLVPHVRPLDLPLSPGERLLLWPELGQHAHSLEVAGPTEFTACHGLLVRLPSCHPGPVFVGFVYLTIGTPQV